MLEMKPMPNLCIQCAWRFTASTHGTVSDIRWDVRAIVSEVQRDVSNTNIHRTMAKGQDGSGRIDLSVSGARTLSTTE